MCCQYLFGGTRVPPGASGPFQGCQELFWDTNPCFGVPGSFFWMPRPVLECLCPSWAAWDPFGKPGPIPGWQDPFLGCQGPFWGARAHLGVPGSVWGWLIPSGGARAHLEVPGSVLGFPLRCQNQFWGTWISLGVQGSVWGYRHPPWGIRANFGVARSVFLGCQDPFWDARMYFGVPGSLPGLSSRGARVCCGVPVSLQRGFGGPFALGVLQHPKAPGCPLVSPSHFGVAAALFGGPSPPQMVWGSQPPPQLVWGCRGRAPGVFGPVVVEIWGHGPFRGAQSHFGELRAVLEGPQEAERKEGPPQNQH